MRGRGADAPALKAGVFDPPRPAPDFALRGSDGSDARRSRATAARSCCWRSASRTARPSARSRWPRWRRRASALGAAADAVQVVYVTVDPERDDAARMRTTSPRFDPTFVGGTGTPAQLAAVRKDYGVTADEGADAARRLRASTTRRSIYLIDRDGRLRAMMPYGHDADDFVHDVKLLLAQVSAGMQRGFQAPARSRRRSRCRAAGRALAWAAFAPIDAGVARRAVRDPAGHLGAPHGRRQGRDPARHDPPDARRQRRAAAAQPGRRAAGVRARR